MVVRKDLADCMKSTDNLEVASAKAVTEVFNSVKSSGIIKLDGRYKQNDLQKIFKPFFMSDFGDYNIPGLGVIGNIITDDGPAAIFGVFISDDENISMYDAYNRVAFSIDDLETDAYIKGVFIIPN